MAKATKIPKIPKNLSDKDMMSGYVEEKTLESHFLAAEAEEDKKRRTKALGMKNKNTSLAGLPDELVMQLDKELLKLQVELFNSGVKDYALRVKRDGNNIIISPKIIK